MAKVALISSAGGHMTQILSIASELRDRHDLFLCVTRFEAVRDIALDDVPRIYYAPHLLRYQHPFGVLASCIAALGTFVRIFRRERPDFLITTGAEVALPALLVNRLFFHRPALYVESLTRITAPSLTGRIASRLATRVFVQWPGLLEKLGSKAEFHGRLL